MDENVLQNRRRIGREFGERRTEQGWSREQAYDTVQPVAMRAMAERADYQELLAENEKVMSLLAREELDGCFTLDYYLKNVDYIYNRVFNK